MRRRAGFAALLVAALFLGVAFVALPLAALLVDVAPGDLVTRLDDRASLDALRLSLQTTAISMAALVRRSSPSSERSMARAWVSRAGPEQRWTSRRAAGLLANMMGSPSVGWSARMSTAVPSPGRPQTTLKQ